jgi:hypothetical protein
MEYLLRAGWGDAAQVDPTNVFAAAVRALGLTDHDSAYFEQNSRQFRFSQPEENYQGRHWGRAAVLLAKLIEDTYQREEQEGAGSSGSWDEQSSLIGKWLVVQFHLELQRHALLLTAARRLTGQLDCSAAGWDTGRNRDQLYGLCSERNIRVRNHGAAGRGYSRSQLVASLEQWHQEEQQMQGKQLEEQRRHREWVGGALGFHEDQRRYELDVQWRDLYESDAVRQEQERRQWDDSAPAAWHSDLERQFEASAPQGAAAGAAAGAEATTADVYCTTRYVAELSGQTSEATAGEVDAFLN